MTDTQSGREALAPCALCAEIAGDPSADMYHQLLGGSDYVRRVILENSRFAVLPSLGPIVDGHLLLCPADHRRRMADLPIEHERAYEDLVHDTVALLQEAYGMPVLQFEHGSSANGREVPCSVEHAHLHLLPVQTRRSPVLPPLPWRPIGPRLGDLKLAVGADQYLMWHVPDGHRLIASAPSAAAFPSQLLRRIIAETVGNMNWNWRTHPDAARADAQYELLRYRAPVGTAATQ